MDKTANQCVTVGIRLTLIFMHKVTWSEKTRGSHLTACKWPERRCCFPLMKFSIRADLHPTNKVRRITYKIEIFMRSPVSSSAQGMAKVRVRKRRWNFSLGRGHEIEHGRRDGWAPSGFAAGTWRREYFCFFCFFFLSFFPLLLSYIFKVNLVIICVWCKPISNE